MNKKLRYIILPKIIWYISGQSIWNKILDIIHYLRKEEPLWKDAMRCEKRFCRYCGGNKKTNK